MNTLTQIFILLISLLGFLFGIILSLIAPEELKPGKKYFFLLKHTLFLIILVNIIYFFIKQQEYLALIILTIIYLTFIIIQFKPRNNYWEIPNYLIFLVPYFLLNQNPTFQLLQTTLIFLYGFPAGTILRFKIFQKQQK
jgi:hypothetical protein